MRLRFFPRAAVLLVFFVGGIAFFPAHAFAQLGVLTTYESEGKAEAKDGDFVKARKTAVWRGLRAAVEKSLKDLLGEEDTAAAEKQVHRILSKPKRYVKSYRFLEMADDDLAQESRVRLEVVLYTDALNKALNSAGLVSSAVNPKAVIVLVLERSFTARATGQFWEFVPMSEVSLTQNLLASGLHVISRDRVANIVPEDRVRSAARGDISSAVDIGLKSGAGVVIVGTAASTKQTGSATGPVSVQANLSVKAVSVVESKVIAAKSDFASARSIDPVEGELQAFEVVGKKMGTFLEDAIKRYWGPGKPAAETPGEAKGAPSSATKPPEDKTPAPAPVPKKPGLMEDL